MKTMEVKSCEWNGLMCNWVVMWSSFFNTEKSREEQRKAEI
ncbi:MAG: hypothetical protein PHH43_05400 [Candidatus Cloacimonetes bacterium]|nr:hypothetical protein [Candidatus Cloacimonadota bacterium]